MRNETRLAFAAHLANQERLNGAPAGGAVQGFTVEPTIQQKLETKIQESSGFLKTINVVPVNEQEGQKLGLGVTGPIASRTDTSAPNTAGRQTRDPSGLDAQNYRCEKTNYDTHIRYQTLDTWAKFPDFQTRVRGVVVNQQALDRIMIGFNGKSVAANTDLVANPLLQDVNIGWLQHMRTDAPARVMETGAKKAGHVYVDAANGGDYNNLDALVFDAIELLDPWARDDTDMRVICGRELMHDKYFPVINANADNPVNTLAGQIVTSQRRIGNLPAITVPFFPPNALMITKLANLSIYYQEGARRSRTEDRPKYDRIETYESSNDAYVIENYGYAAMVENIVLGAPPQA